MNFEQITKFESALGAFTGAPFVVMTDCCTHALELCLRYEKPEVVVLPQHTYLSVPMLLHNLNIPYTFDLIGVTNTNASTAAILGTLEPVLAGVFAWIWLGETFNLIQLIGAAAVITAIYIATKAREITPQIVPE